MPDENRIAAKTVGEDGNRQRFHQGNTPHILPAELSEEEEATLKIHRASIHGPESKPRWGYDEDGNPVEVGPQGLIGMDPLTGAVEPLTEESAARAEKIHAHRAEQAEARYAAGAPLAPVPPLPAELSAPAPTSGADVGEADSRAPQGRQPSGREDRPERPPSERPPTQRSKD